MITTPLENHLHRGVKLALDSGEVSSIEEAMALFRSYRLVLEAGLDVARSASLQAALLTAINTGRRCFLGGVEVIANPDLLNTPLRVPCMGLRTLGNAIVSLHGMPSSTGTPHAPRIVIGDVRTHDDHGPFTVRATVNGWSAAVAPVQSGIRLDEHQDFTPAGVLAGGLAISEAFQYVRRDTLDAGHRVVGLSLWRPSPDIDWATADPGPALERLPSRLWLIGLGHLGQAYLWTLGFLPYANAADVDLVLQDFDVLTDANDSTSPLTFPGMVGMKKTRAMAAWAEQRGFRTKIVERPFAPNFTVSGDEPQLALCGVDNAMARAALEDTAFRRVVEAGLGKGTREYLAMQIHTFPSSCRSARTRWGSQRESDPIAELLAQPGYRALAGQGLDECGMTTLAGRSVGASFVGTITSTMVIAEILRLAIGETMHSIVDMTLRAPHRRRVIGNDAVLGPFNGGSTPAGWADS